MLWEEILTNLGKFLVVGILKDEPVELLNANLYMVKLFDVIGGYEVWMAIRHKKEILDYFFGRKTLSEFLEDVSFYIRDKYDDYIFTSNEPPDDLIDEVRKVANFYLEPAPALFPYYSKALLIE